MYCAAVKYKDTWLAPGSEAMALYDAKKFDKLDKLLSECDKTYRKISGL